MILGLLAEAVAAGARQERACEELGLDARTLQRWKRRGIGEDGRAGPRHPPSNKLSERERAQVLAVANAPEHRDLSPNQIVPRLADLGEYLASESSFYRILREAGQQQHRELSRAPTGRHRPDELIADGPNQVWSWDISYLPTLIRGRFFYLYLVMDVWSRKIVGWEVHDQESSELAAQLIATACADEGVDRGQLVIHSDNGAPMKGAMLLATLQMLGVLASFSRPRVSDDNPYSEALFRTTKSRPSYPRDGFADLEAARRWVAGFVRWYNHEHRHSAIRFVTPEQRHTGADVSLLTHRGEVYERARVRHPERWSRTTRDWSRPELVALNPEHASAPEHRAA
jgi:putative transposase